MTTILPRYHINMTHVRAKITELIDMTLLGEQRVILTRHNKEVAALVTIDELHRIWADEDYDLYGPINPRTGRRFGAVWVRETQWRRPLFESEIDPTPAAKDSVNIEQSEMSTAERDAFLAHIEAKIKSWEAEDLVPTDEGEGKVEVDEPQGPTTSVAPQRTRWGWWKD